MGQALLDRPVVVELESLAVQADIPEQGACAHRLDAQRRLVAVRDRQARTVYALGHRPTGGYGWMAAYEEPHGWVCQPGSSRRPSRWRWCASWAARRRWRS
jgi:hypothetical protein